MTPAITAAPARSPVQHRASASEADERHADREHDHRSPSNRATGSSRSRTARALPAAARRRCNSVTKAVYSASWRACSIRPRNEVEEICSFGTLRRPDFGEEAVRLQRRRAVRHPHALHLVVADEAGAPAIFPRDPFARQPEHPGRAHQIGLVAHRPGRRRCDGGVVVLRRMSGLAFIAAVTISRSCAFSSLLALLALLAASLYYAYGLWVAVERRTCRPASTSPWCWACCSRS